MAHGGHGCCDDAAVLQGILGRVPLSAPGPADPDVNGILAIADQLAMSQVVGEELGKGHARLTQIGRIGADALEQPVAVDQRQVAVENPEAQVKRLQPVFQQRKRNLGVRRQVGRLRADPSLLFEALPARWAYNSTSGFKSSKFRNCLFMHSALKPRLRTDCRFAAGRSHTNVSFWLLADALAGLPGGPV